MTENITPVPIDRTTHIKARVMDAINDGYELIFRRLDELHKRDIHDDDVVGVLRNLGENELLDAYADWAEINLDDIEPEGSTDDVVPDPHGAGSYDTMQTPATYAFTGQDLMDKLQPELSFSYVAQTGGGTATLVFRKDPEDNPILGGPGGYHWNNPGLSVFQSGEFYYGPDTIGMDDADPKYDGPGETMDPAWTLAQLAEKIKATYAQYNPEGAAK